MQAHVNQYHEGLNQCRFCPFKACLAELLRHMEQNCDDEEINKSEEKDVSTAEEAEDDKNKEKEAEE